MGWLKASSGKPGQGDSARTKPISRLTNSSVKAQVSAEDCRLSGKAGGSLAHATAVPSSNKASNSSR